MARGTTLYLRGLPEPLVREAKAAAARRGVTLTALVAEALQQALGVSVPLPGTGRARPSAADRPAPQSRGDRGGKGDVVDRLAQSMRWFEANRGRLLRRYRDRYVAIEGGRVIDHDRDFDALARRVFARAGPGPLFMPKVTPEERVVAVPSPRLVQD